MPDKDFTFEIEEHFGIISSREEGWNKELNLVRWNGAAAKYDIREWDEHHEQMRRGITLTQWEMRKVVDLFVSRNNHAAVARGRAIEAERNARKIAARRKAEAVSAVGQELTQVEETAAAHMSEQQVLEEGQALEGAVAPSERTPAGEELAKGDAFSEEFSGAGTSEEGTSEGETFESERREDAQE